MILIRAIPIGMDDTSEFHTDFGSELSVTLRWEKAPELCTEHLYSEEWMCEENGKTHFHECILCGEQLDIAEHTTSDWIVDKAATLTEKGSQHQECTICKIILNVEEIPLLEPEVPKHVHQYEDRWTFNETHHWKKCITAEGVCTEPEGEKAEHHFDKTYTCETCGYSYNELLPKLTAPKITAGANQIYRQKSNQNLTITCSDNIENLTGVYVAEGLVHKSNYVTDSKNQTVTLKVAYLDSLASGTHSLKLAFSNGTCTETQFTIQKTAAVKTGDKSNYLPLIILLILSGGVLIVTSVIRKKGFNG